VFFMLKMKGLWSERVCGVCGFRERSKGVNWM
jgi:hypothetical protein